MGDFDDDFLPMVQEEPSAEPAEPEEKSWRDHAPTNSPPPTECPECGGEVEEKFRCGDYVKFRCTACELNIRHFPSQPLATWRDEEDEEEEGDGAQH